eukprot:TRINITY_DN67954_c5_g11_i1.p1 TRINITY_DN67954_c5_g11~~TRINITY_DN67954_c5_g11_i1.p1  ORF type:complete len:532 (+),score=64.74 TRINITY_DN67954_c5_g11_i1:104-1699(+)
MHPKVLRAVSVVYLSVMIDMLGSSLIMPVTPFLTIKVGGNQSQVGTVFAAYAAAQLVSTLWMGKFSDRFGRKLTFIISMLGSCVGLLGTGVSQNPGQLIASRAVGGFFAGSSGAANAYISDVTSKEERPRYLALVGAAAAISFVVGPPVGSGLAQFTLRVPAFVASGAALFGLLLTLFFIQNPKTLQASLSDKPTKKVKAVQDGDAISVQEVPVETETPSQSSSGAQQQNDEENPASPVPQEPEEPPKKVRWHFVLMIGFMSFTNVTAFTVISALLALWLQQVKGYGSLETGFIFTGAAILGVIDQVLLFNWVRVKIGLPLTAVLGGTLAAAGAMLVPWFDGHLAPVLIGIGVMTIGNFFVTSGIPSLLSFEATGKNTGTILSVGQFASAGARIVAPIMYTQVIQRSLEVPWVISAGASVVTLLVALILYFLMKPPKEKVDTEPLTEEGEHAKEELEGQTEVATYFINLLKERNYKFFHRRARVGIKQRIEETFPYLRPEGEERMEDIRAFLAELSDAGAAVLADHPLAGN